MSDWGSGPLSDTVELFLIADFFRGALLWANSGYLPPPYSFYGEVTGSCSIDIPWYLYRYSGHRFFSEIDNFIHAILYRFIFQKIQIFFLISAINQGYSTCTKFSSDVQGACFRNAQSLDTDTAARVLSGPYCSPTQRRGYNGTGPSFARWLHHHPSLETQMLKITPEPFRCILCKSHERADQRQFSLCRCDAATEAAA